MCCLNQLETPGPPPSNHLAANVPFVKFGSVVWMPTAANQKVSNSVFHTSPIIKIVWCTFNSQSLVVDMLGNFTHPASDDEIKSHNPNYMCQPDDSSAHLLSFQHLSSTISLPSATSTSGVKATLCLRSVANQFDPLGSSVPAASKDSHTTSGSSGSANRPPFR